jgi:hypothetical protein
MNPTMKNHIEGDCLIHEREEKDIQREAEALTHHWHRKMANYAKSFVFGVCYLREINAICEKCLFAFPFA